MYLFTVTLLVFILLVFLTSRLKKEETPAPKKEYKPDEIDLDKLENCLNWLMQHQIIDHRQYNELLRKSVPYL